MGSTLTRKQILESGAQRVGNAAAHLAIYDTPLSIHEAEEYQHQARIVIARKNWNDQEIARFREIAVRRAKKELVKRSKKEPYFDPDIALKDAIEKIDEFIEKDFRR